MATIIENGTPAPSRNVYMTGEDSSSAWAVVVLVLVVAVIAGAIWYMRYYRPASYSTTPSTVQVNLPSAGYAPAQSSSATTNTNTTPSPATPTTPGAQ